MEDLEEGIYIQQNVDTVLFNFDGNQLLTESIYLYGLMLMITDIKFEGKFKFIIIPSVAAEQIMLNLKKILCCFFYKI